MEEDYSDKCDEHAKKYFKTEDEFKLDRIRNHFSSISTYFETKKMLEDGKIPEDQKEGVEKLLKEAEENCHVNVKKICKILEFKKDKN